MIHGQARDSLVEKNERVHGLVLGGGRHVLVHRQVGEKGFDLRFGGQQILAGPHVVEMDEPDNPVGIGSLGGDGIVVKAEELSDLIKQSGLLVFVRGGNSILLQKRTPVQVDNRSWAMCARNSPIYPIFRAKLPVNHMVRPERRRKITWQTNIRT
jgi:hypothetical protein